MLLAVCPLSESTIDPPHLGASCRKQLRSDGSVSGPSVESSTCAPWWRRPIAVVGGTGGTGGCSSASQLGWSVLPSAWMLDSVSIGEIVAPPTEWLRAGSRAHKTKRGAAAAGSSAAAVPRTEKAATKRQSTPLRSNGASSRGRSAPSSGRTKQTRPPRLHSESNKATETAPGTSVVPGFRGWAGPVLEVSQEAA